MLQSETIDGEIRNLNGGLTFNSVGQIEGGTQITLIPGLTIDISSDVSIVEVNNSNRFTGKVLSTKEGISITPSVNGYISIQGNFFNASTSLGNIILSQGDAGGTYYKNLTEITTPLIAGQTYVFSTTSQYPFEIGQIAFRPAFLGYAQPYTAMSTEYSRSNVFTASMSTPTEKFPQFVNGSNPGNVKFSGDRTKVFLYTDGHVKLLDGGTNVLVKGTVIDPSNTNKLFACYYLNANVLTLTGTDPAFPIEVTTNNGTKDSYTIKPEDFTDYRFRFIFNQNIVESSAGLSVTVQKDGDAETVLTNDSRIISVWEDRIIVDLKELYGVGNVTNGTYTIKVKANSVVASSDNSLSNADLKITFNIGDISNTSTTAAPGINMIHPTSIANVGTSIVLAGDYVQTNKNNNDVGIKNQIVVQALLKGGTQEMLLTSTIASNRLIFKPTEVLQPNTEYTLTVYSNGVDGNGNKITFDDDKTIDTNKIFSFVTGAASGSAPTSIETSPVDETTNVTYVDSSHPLTVSITFDQDIQLEPYSHLYIDAFNGNFGHDAGSEMNNGPLTMGSDNRTVQYTITATDALKYDVTYEVTLPVNSVTGVAGIPNNEPVKFWFRMKPNSNAKATTYTDGAYKNQAYKPYTWDFTRMSVDTKGIFDAAVGKGIDYVDGNGKHVMFPNNRDISDSQVADFVEGVPSNTRWYHDKNAANGYYSNYTSKNSSSTIIYPQGEQLQVFTDDNTSNIIREMEGIRISLNARDRAAARNRLRVKIPESQGGDGVWTGSHLCFIGNTHYLTIPNIPKGNLYVHAEAASGDPSQSFLNINSKNAKFVMGDGVRNEYEVENDGQDHKFVINVEEKGDVVLAVANAKLYQIGVAVTEDKFIGSTTYATDSWPYDIRYELTKMFTENNVDGYYIYNATNYDTNVESVSSTKIDVSESGSGVILKRSTEAGDNYCLFKTDVNSPKKPKNNNLLVGNPSDGAVHIGRTEGSNTNYVFTNLYYTTDAEGNISSVDNKQHGSAEATPGFYKVVAGGGNLGAHKAYLQLKTASNGTEAKSYVFFNLDFEEENGVATTIGNARADEVAGEAYYTLSGVKIDYPTEKGIYIKNGKKIVIK
ncbi:MAG: Ig-like domain-containing protein [Bacteroidaceae bacterium]|nr:Ig-like domain-containing protein [Bacteroidaceae bacterium]